MLPMAFDHVLEIIHETIGCVSVAVKPALTYKLAAAPLQSLPISLTCDEDWEGLVETAIGAHKKKTKAAQATPPSVSILVSDQVCLQ